MSICQIYDLCADTLWLGRYNENGARDIAIDVGKWIADLGTGGTVVLVNWRPGEDDSPYNPNITMDGSRAVWSPSNIDLAISGRGFAELRYYVGNVLAKSKTFRTVIDRTPSEGANPPSAAEDWLERMEDAAVTAQTASETAVDAAETATEGAQTVAQALPTVTQAAGTATNAATEAAASEEVASVAANAAQTASESATAASQTAVSAATTATTKATQAVEAAGTATTKASEATQAATTATANAQTSTAKAGEATTAAATATFKATEATTAASTASAAAITATGAASTATSAASTATAAKTAAQTAQTRAETARGAAELAAASVSASAAQIATNTADIGVLKTDLSDLVTKQTILASASEATESAIILIDGSTTTNSAYKSTDYIDCSALSRIEYKLAGGTTTSPTMSLLSFFDSSKTFILAIPAVINNGFVESDTPVPVGAKYVKATVRQGVSTVPYVVGVYANSISAKTDKNDTKIMSEVDSVEFTPVFDDPVCYLTNGNTIRGGSSGALRRMSRKIDISNFSTIRYGLVGISTQRMIVFYDSDLNVVGYKTGTSSNAYETGEMLVPTGAKYVSGAWLSTFTNTPYIVGVNADSAKAMTSNLYAVTNASPQSSSLVVNAGMTLSEFKTAFDAKRQEYADSCLASIKGFVQMFDAPSWAEVYKRANWFFRKDIYIDGISHALFCDRVNAAFETPVRRFMDAKISNTICDFSFLVHEGQGGEPSLVVSPDGGTLWAYSYGTRWESTDGVAWGNPTLIVRSDADTSASPYHMGISVAGDMIFLFGRDQTSPYNLKMYTSPITDGINFTYRGVPFAIGHDFGDGLEIDSWGNSAITKIGDTYYLFIEGRQSVDGNFWDIYVATATDPLIDNGDGTVGNWTNGAVAPILNGLAIWGGTTPIACGNPDIARGADNMPIRVDGKFFMYYHMTASSYSYIRRAYSYDLIHWTDEQAIFDNRKIPTAGENQSSNADHSLIEFKGKTYMVYTHDINTTRTPHLYEMVDDRTFREMLSIRP